MVFLLWRCCDSWPSFSLYSAILFYSLSPRRCWPPHGPSGWDIGQHINHINMSEKIGPSGTVQTLFDSRRLPFLLFFHFSSYFLFSYFLATVSKIIEGRMAIKD